MPDEPITVLLVEDNPDDADLLQETLAEASPQRFAMTLVESLQDALHRATAERFDVMLLDLGLPDSVGLETLTRTCEQAPDDLPIVVLSGNRDQELALKGVQAGAQDYLVKGTVSCEVLVRTIHYAIERKRLTSALFRSEELFRSVVQHSTDLITILDRAGVIRYASPSYQPILGYEPQEMIGQSLFAFVHPDDVPTVRNGLPSCPARADATWTMQGRFRHRDGAWRIVELICTNLLDHPAIQGVVTNGRDVTERQRAEDDLKRLSAELKRSNQDLDDFAAIASHDLKEPLRGIHSLSEFLLADYGAQLDTAGRTQLQTIAALVRRLEAFINALYYYSRLGRDALAVGVMDLNRVVAEVLEALAPSLREANAEVRLTTPLPTLCCDRVRIGEVFHNLIVNALKYNDKPYKRIDIGGTTGQVPETDTSPTTTAERPLQAPWIFFVRDNGIGIAEKHHDRIFTIFKRLHGRDRYGGGTGVGLTIVGKIIERHGGRIWLESTPGVGTTFYFTLGERGMV